MGLFESVSSTDFGLSTTVILSSGPWPVTNPLLLYEKTPNCFSLKSRTHWPCSPSQTVASALSVWWFLSHVFAGASVVTSEKCDSVFVAAADQSRPPLLCRCKPALSLNSIESILGKRRPWYSSGVQPQRNRWIVLMWASSLCNACSIHTKAGRGDGVETDRNSCADNEECCVFKGLRTTPEVCFRSLIRERRGHYGSTQTSGWTCLWDLVTEIFPQNMLRRSAS